MKTLTRVVEMQSAGAGPACDGQVLVWHDLVGLSFGVEPKFARRYADLRPLLEQAIGRFVADVTGGAFPGEAETTHLPAEVREQWQSRARR